MISRTMFAVAGNHLDLAEYHLRQVRADYAASSLPRPVKQARLASLDAKIAALHDIRTDPDAHPWSEDSVEESA